MGLNFVIVFLVVTLGLCCCCCVCLLFFFGKFSTKDDKNDKGDIEGNHVALAEQEGVKKVGGPVSPLSQPSQYEYSSPSVHSQTQVMISSPAPVNNSNPAPVVAVVPVKSSMSNISTESSGKEATPVLALSQKLKSSSITDMKLPDQPKPKEDLTYNYFPPSQNPRNESYIKHNVFGHEYTDSKFSLLEKQRYNIPNPTPQFDANEEKEDSFDGNGSIIPESGELRGHTHGLSLMSGDRGHRSGRDSLVSSEFTISTEQTRVSKSASESGMSTAKKQQNIYKMLERDRLKNSTSHFKKHTEMTNLTLQLSRNLMKVEPRMDELMESDIESNVNSVEPTPGNIFVTDNI